MNRRLSTLAATMVVAIIAFAWWWFELRTRPEAVGPRFVDGVTHRHPGTMVQPLDGGLVRVALPSGLLVDVALSRVFTDCADDRLHCTSAIDRAIDDVDGAEASTTSPDRASLRPIVIAEPGGYRHGFIEEPLVGAYAVRYALVRGVASTFVTSAIAARMSLPPDALRATAISNLDAETGVSLEPVGADAPGSYRVRSSGDPAASLLDVVRMRRFAEAIGARRLYAAIPVRGTLALAAMDDASARALDALRTTLRGSGTRTVDGGLLAYDVDAADGSRLSDAVRTTTLAR